MSLRKPNVLFIMADQMIPFLTGAYGHPVVKTPNLDRLVEEGIRFDAAYSPCPICVPARASLLTGRHVSRIGTYDNAASFSCEEPTFAHHMTRAGYDAVVAGKMHLIGSDQLHGFRKRFNTNVYPTGFDWVPGRGLDDKVSKRHAEQYVGRNVHVGRWSQFLSYDEETHLRALEYLHAKGVERGRAAAAGGKASPFFLFVSYHHPHEPFWPPPELWNLYEDEEVSVPELPENLEDYHSTLDEWLNYYHGVHKVEDLTDPESMRRVRRAYYALVTYVDRRVGELLDSLEENGFRENTVVIFTSDHGDMLLERGMVQKRTFYEWSTRVPLIFRFPDGRWGGMVRPEPVSLIDLFPTFLDLAGVAEAERLPVDGRSLMGLIDGSDSEDWEAVSEFHSQGAHTSCFMIRQGRHKYVYIHGYESQLFDLQADPGEWNNLAGDPDYAEVEDRLRGRIFELFDPAAVDEEVMTSVRKRKVIKKAMAMTGTRWDFEPRFDPAKGVLDQYLSGRDLDEIPR